MAMKLLVFAHTPPPHHGQSYMVELMLQGFGGDRRGRHESSGPGAALAVDCYHVNARLSRRLEDIGDLQVGKLFLVLWFCLQAIWCRYRYGVTNLYYVPAPGKRSAVYRDWVVLFLCRPFFKRFILHWHASGLARWLETEVQMPWRRITYSVAKAADLSIVLSDYGRADALKLLPREISVVGNGIPDPCPEFFQKVLPRRQARLSARRLLFAGQTITPELATAAGADRNIVKILFLAHCTREKGLLDTVRGVILAHHRLFSKHSPISMKLLVGGQFVDAEVKAAFDRLCADEGRGVVEHVGFVSGDRKRELFEQADIFCFPSYLESFGLVLVEAMAFGLPIVTSRRGALPELMHPDYVGLVEAGRPDEIAEALLQMMSDESFKALRLRFESEFKLEHHLSKLAAALQAVEGGVPA
jgi:glycosyltransferase involved in cell wall biosynthesis